MKQQKASFAFSIGWGTLPLLLIVFYCFVLQPTVLILVPLNILAFGVCSFAGALMFVAAGIYYFSPNVCAKQAAKSVAVGTPASVLFLGLFMLAMLNVSGRI